MLFWEAAMPRHSDPNLEGRIIGAARKLWHKGGERALSMRAVAKAAGTNTPAVYRRFRTREQILRALVQSYQEELFWLVEPCGSPEDHKSAVFAIWSLLHGTAMLRITGTLRDEDFPQARAAFVKSVEVLVANGQKLRAD